MLHQSNLNSSFALNIFQVWFGWVFFVLISACSSWPDSGQGGAAEYRPPSHAMVAVPNELKMQYDLARLRWQTLGLLGGKNCMPARLLLIRDDLIRVVRELSGGLIDDAKNDLIILSRELNRIEKRLDYLRSKTDCEQVSVMSANSNTSAFGGLGTPLLIHFDDDSSQVSKGYQSILKHFVQNLERYVDISSQ